MTKNTHTCWIVTEGLAGTENQCIGVAEALEVHPEVIRVKLRQPWKTLSPFIGLEHAYSFIPSLSPPWPDLLIASGRKSIAASRYVRKQSGGKTITVQIQDPRISAKHFDLVAAPAHDRIRGKNVLVTSASPNRITQERLQTEKALFPDLELVNSPRIAVLIGGNSKAYSITPALTEKIAESINKLDGGLLVTCSRRTPENCRKILETKWSGGTNFYWSGEGANPYFAILGWADYILVTADSASMISEGCTTGKPVYMIDLEGGNRKLSALHESLMQHGALRKFEGKLEKFDYEPLNDAKTVAQEIKKRFGLFTDGG